MPNSQGIGPVVATLVAFVLAVCAVLSVIPPWDRRIGRFRAWGDRNVAGRAIPWFWWTAHNAVTPWVWRLYWFRIGIGWMKADWARPTRLSRQLRRQLERKGELIMPVERRFA